MTLAKLPGWAIETLESERVARLSYLDEDDHPRVLPITYALAGDHIWSAIDHKPKRTAEPARLRCLRRRPQAAICVDVYSDDWGRLRWVQLLGRIEVLDPGTDERALSALEARYRQYRERRPEGELLRLAVDRALCWRADEGV